MHANIGIDFLLKKANFKGARIFHPRYFLKRFYESANAVLCPSDESDHPMFTRNFNYQYHFSICLQHCDIFMVTLFNVITCLFWRRPDSTLKPDFKICLVFVHNYIGLVNHATM